MIILIIFYLFLDNNRDFRSPRFIIEMSDLDIEEGYSATFKVKLDFGYPKARVLFYRNQELLLNDKRHEICNFLLNLISFNNPFQSINPLRLLR